MSNDVVDCTDYQQILGYRFYSGAMVELADLSVFFHKIAALQKINLTIPAGQTTAIVGANGSGKSTLIKAILGQFRHQGEIRIHWPDKASTHIAYVPQHIDFDRELPMNAEDFMGMLLQGKPIFLGLHKDKKAIVEHLLSRVDMLSCRHTKIGKLSGGELKRILLIQAMYPEPGLILLDEPLAALDKPGVAMFSRFLREWQAMGKTILWVEHDLLAVQQLAHHLVALNKSLIHVGKPADLKDSTLLMNIFSHAAGGGQNHV